MSSDFLLHSSRHFLEPLLAHHRHDAVEVYAYSGAAREDAVTERYKTYADHWVRTRGLSSEELAARIRADGIDILVDVSGHTSGNRLEVFARKPAPVSISWLGFGYTTGLSAVDYFLCDEPTVPQGHESFFSETPWRLGRPALAYRPAEGMGDVNALPAIAQGHVTFGTLTRSIRVNHRTVKRWAQVLNRVENSRLVIDSRDYLDAWMRADLAAQFEQQGVARERVRIGFHTPPWDLMRTMDITLDCFPHNSGTTLFESLYMGIPFVTLADRPGVGRLGSAILTGVGHAEWIAHTEEEYVDAAVSLAQDLPRLAALRAGLRADMERSPLMDEAGFAAEVEAAYQQMWRRWLDATGAGAPAIPKSPAP